MGEVLATRFFCLVSLIHLLQAYASILAVVSVTRSSTITHIAIRHLCFVLLAAWLVFAYRDLYPLATYDHSPIDSDGGVALWVYIGILSVAAILIPLCIPRAYVPLDPKVRSFNKGYYTESETDVIVFVIASVREIPS